MTPKNLEDLYLHDLRDLYSAETQIAEALPKLIDKTTNQRLKDALRHHLEETRVHKDRIEQIFSRRSVSPAGETCDAMKGLIKESNSFLSDAKSLFGHDAPDSVLDAGVIAHVQRVEHYEIAGYGTVCTYAEMLGHRDEYQLLSDTLAEEKAADSSLNEVAKQIVNPAAAAAAH